MNDNDKHLQFLNKLESPFDTSKDELWDKIAERTIEKRKTKTIQLSWLKYSAAAVVALLIGLTSFLKFYTKTITAEKGEHIAHVLPDGSKIEINAATTIRYNPYWWTINRELSLSGEAFFDVKKGESFTVVSENGLTEVLGTSFNIYARDTDYEVYCKTGKVRVASTKSNVELIISPGEFAILDNKLEKGNIEKRDDNIAIAWKYNKFIFTAKPITKVIEEIERQYNVEISHSTNNLKSLIYSGNFNKTSSVEESLNIICKSFNLNFEEIGKNKYKIYLNN